MKVCLKCGVKKELYFFNDDKFKKANLKGFCKNCVVDYLKKKNKLKKIKEKPQIKKTILKVKIKKVKPKKVKPKKVKINKRGNYEIKEENLINLSLFKSKFDYIVPNPIFKKSKTTRIRKHYELHNEYNLIKKRNGTIQSLIYYISDTNYYFTCDSCKMNLDYKDARVYISEKDNELIINEFRCKYCQEKYFKDRREKDPIFKLRCILSTRTSLAFKSKRWNRGKSTEQLIGCNYKEAHKHLEKQFTKGMTWENQGEWHIDHIIPLSSAKTESELIKLCNYTNLQALWAKDNISKGSKIPMISSF